MFNQINYQLSKWMHVFSFGTNHWNGILSETLIHLKVHFG